VAADPPAEEPAAEPEAEKPKEEPVDDLLSSPAFLKQKLKVLEKELTKLKEDTEVAKAEAAEQIEAFGEKRERLQTDFDNFKTRNTKSALDAQLTAQIKLLQDFLPVVDNYDRARGIIQVEGPEQEAVAAQYEELYATLEKALADLGVTKIKTVGTEFDYNTHMAIQTEPSDEYEEGIVCEEMQTGYQIGEKLVRAAYVKVSAGP
jgi:molecular chaperone GrpE